MSLSGTIDAKDTYTNGHSARVADAIINKETRLTDEEYAAIKQHPVLGGADLKKYH